MTDKKRETAEKTTDLSDLDYINTSQESGYEVEILHPKTGESLGMWVSVAGPDSDKARRAIQRGVDRALRAQRTRRPSSADIQDNYVRQLAETCISWKGFQENGQPIEFTPENVAKVFRRFPFIREQVDAAAADRANFI